MVKDGGSMFGLHEDKESFNEAKINENISDISDSSADTLEPVLKKRKLDVFGRSSQLQQVRPDMDLTILTSCSLMRNPWL